MQSVERMQPEQRGCTTVPQQRHQEAAACLRLRCLCTQRSAAMSEVSKAELPRPEANQTLSSDRARPALASFGGCATNAHAGSPRSNGDWLPKARQQRIQARGESKETLAGVRDTCCMTQPGRRLFQRRIACLGQARFDTSSPHGSRRTTTPLDASPKR